MTYFVVMFYFATDEQVFATGLFFSGIACQTIADFINEIFYNGITPANDNKVRRCVRVSLNGDRFEFGKENTNDATFSEVDEVILMKFIEDSVENDEGLTLADATKHARQLVIERNKFMQLFPIPPIAKKEEKSQGGINDLLADRQSDDEYIPNLEVKKVTYPNLEVPKWVNRRKMNKIRFLYYQ